MAHSATVQLRVNQDTKDSSFNVFKRHGLTLTDGIRIYLERVAITGEIPFSVNIPNDETQKAMQEISAGTGVKNYASKETLFAHLRQISQKHA
jgi:addiction module RelB/DinJ family antitoxin